MDGDGPIDLRPFLNDDEELAAFVRDLNAEEQALNAQLQSITALGPTDEAVEALGEFVDGNWERTDGRLPIFVATAAMYRAWGLQELGRTDESIEAFTRVAERFGDSSDSDLSMMTIAASVERGSMLAGADGIAAAVDLMMERYDDRDDPRVRDQLATARLQQAAAYRAEGRASDVERVVETMQAEFAADTSEVTLAALAGAENLVANDPGSGATGPGTSGDSFGSVGQSEALTMLGTARAHLANGNTDPGVAVLDEIIERWGGADADNGADDPDGGGGDELPVAIHARLMKAAVIAEADRDAAMSMLHEIVDRFGDHRSIEVRRQVAAARINIGVELAKAADPTATRAWFDDTVIWIDGTDGHELDIQLAAAMFYAGMSALEMNDTDGALGRFGGIIDRFIDSPEPAIRNIVARSMLNSAAVYVELDQPQMSLAALDVLLERFGPDADSALGDESADLTDVVASARAFRAELTGDES